jgi:hypothetical protein
MAPRLRILLVFALLLVLAPTQSAFAQRDTLRVGGDAPALDCEEWVNGGPVSFESGKTYFVFFFEVEGEMERLLPSVVLDAIKPLVALYDFEVVGITSSDASDAERFVRQLDDTYDMPIGIDSRKRVRRAWVDASKAPTSNGGSLFIVDGGGKVQYIGTGGGTVRETLFPQILSQRYDAGLFRRTEGLRQAKETAREVRNWRLFEQHHAELIELDKRVFALANIVKFETLVLDRNDRAAAYAFVEELAEQYADDPRFLLDLAVYIADSRKLTDAQRDLDAALALARLAGTTMRDDNPLPLSTEALVLLRKGDVDGAVRMQRRAFRVAPVAVKAQYRRTLDTYQDIRDQRRSGGR